MVSSDLSSAEKESTAVIAHLTGTPTVADCFYKESDNGYHVITKLDKGSLAIDTSFDPTPCAKAITDFTDNRKFSCEYIWDIRGAAMPQNGE